MAVINLIEKDSKARKLARLLKKGRFKFDCQAAIREIRQLHRDRLGRTLKVNDVIHHSLGIKNELYSC